jgi:A/G-specific adenine glycosylase
MTGPVSGLAGFAPALIRWQRQSGRHGLPWQGTREPYRVWLSEIMLQQTQVATVLGYYERFLARFPDVHALASASPDEVMAMWSGLGYYSRARHLHRCAQEVVAQHAGVFPASAEALARLPGIGESTAAAIAAFCHGERVSIVDGNVRRVLSRLLAFEGDLSQGKAQRLLWAHAQALLPEAPQGDDMKAYTQGLMDLGAGPCARTRPDCERCPVNDLCLARARGEVARYPVKTRRLQRRSERWWLLVVRRTAPGGLVQVWLERRPSRGIWAGLHCVPVFASESEASSAAAGRATRPLAVLNHSLTHRELFLHPWLVDLACADAWAGDAAGQWLALGDLDRVGLPAPVRGLLATLAG